MKIGTKVKVVKAKDKDCLTFLDRDGVVISKKNCKGEVLPGTIPVEVRGMGNFCFYPEELATV